MVKCLVVEDQRQRDSGDNIMVVLDPIVNTKGIPRKVSNLHVEVS